MFVITQSVARDQSERLQIAQAIKPAAIRGGIVGLKAAAHVR